MMCLGRVKIKYETSTIAELIGLSCLWHNKNAESCSVKMHI